MTDTMTSAMPQAAAAPSTAQAFAAERLALFGAGDAQGLIAQYAPDAVVITANGVISDPKAIAAMIEGIIAEFHREGVSFTLLGQAAVGDVAWFCWRAETLAHRYDHAAETYVLKEGRIACQTFAAKVAPR